MSRHFNLQVHTNHHVLGISITHIAGRRKLGERRRSGPIAARVVLAIGRSATTTTTTTTSTTYHGAPCPLFALHLADLDELPANDRSGRHKVAEFGAPALFIALCMLRNDHGHKFASSATAVLQRFNYQHRLQQIHWRITEPCVSRCRDLLPCQGALVPMMMSLSSACSCRRKPQYMPFVVAFIPLEPEGIR